jgi:hypothetical protein
MARTRPCTPDIRRGRLRKSAQFLDAAGPIAEMAGEQSEIADVCVTRFAGRKPRPSWRG